MSDKAALKLERGTKRTCQNPECGERFYDLNRDPVTCPICNSVYASRSSLRRKHPHDLRHDP